MKNNTKYILLYIRNGNEIKFTVNTIEHAIKIADSIADSDLLNDEIDYNMFDLFDNEDGDLGNTWMSDDGDDFNEYWRGNR